MKKEYDLREDVEWVQLSQRWLEVHTKLKALELEEQKLKAELIKLAQSDHSKGGGVCLSCLQYKGQIDYSKIPELKNVDLESYRKESKKIWFLKTL